MDEREYSLLEHLGELRKRLGYAVIGIGIITVLGFAFSNQLLTVLREPMEKLLRETRGGDAHFVVISPAEYIMCQMQAALVAALFVGSPWVLYQIWLFIAPGLYDHEKKYVGWFVWAGAFFFVAGGAFCYFAVFPTMFRFFLESLPKDIAMMPSIKEHFAFTLRMLIAFGVVFETPVVLVILSIAGIIDPASLGKYRSYVVVLALIIGAVLTPTPDAVSQLLLAGPLMVLYELGVLVSRVIVKMQGTPLSREQRAKAHAATHPAQASTAAPQSAPPVATPPPNLEASADGSTPQKPSA